MTRRRVTAAAELAALAHPLRLELLELLVVHGATTASEAAAALDQTPSNVSWHLRKLARHGFVRQATSGPGRRRPWKVVAEALSWGDDADDPTLVTALHDVAVERELQRLRRALTDSAAESPSWRQATVVHQSRLWLTADEAADIGRQVEELWTSKAERGRDAALRPEGARAVALMGWVVPAGPVPASARGAQPDGAPPDQP